MGLCREAPVRLDRLAELPGRWPSAELVLHPPRAPQRLAEPVDLETSYQRGHLRPLPDDPARLHFRVDPRLAPTVRRLRGDPAAYRAHRPRASGLPPYLAAQVYKLSKDAKPLTVTRAA